ncbi:unnamed protein product [marine sediment metagenome]|uniref:Uncharacterized protein n=1 Tax=marine sediment metagenome TaxID=412755 RepID=X1KMX8_9ZZZZ
MRRLRYLGNTHGVVNNDTNFFISICLAIDSALTVFQQLKVFIPTNPKNSYIVSNNEYR